MADRTMIELNHLTLSRNGKNLIEDADARIHPGQRVGLTGRNGSGKSTLLALLRHDLEPDSGDYRLPPDWRIASVAQETPALPDSAHDYVLAGHAPYQAALAAIAAAEASGDGHAIAKAHEQLAACDGYAQPARASELLAGLGFPPVEQQRSVASYSGGWRMRLNLARALIAPAELLLLDEPTNHLDLAMRDDLTLALQNYDGAMLIISHDRSLLRATCDEFRLVVDGKLQPFDGDLDDYHRYLNEQNRAATKHPTNTDGTPNRQEQKRLDAERRSRLRPLKQALEAAEKAVAAAEKALAKHKTALADAALYDTANKDRLKEILAAESAAQQILAQAEADWLEAAEALQAADAAEDA